MPQFTTQELKWIDQVLRRDIDNSKSLLPGCAEKPSFAEIIKLDIANKEALRSKISQTIERAKSRAARLR